MILKAKNAIGYYRTACLTFSCGQGRGRLFFRTTGKGALHAWQTAVQSFSAGLILWAPGFGTGTETRFQNVRF